jgi:hypothetical protein
MTTFFREVQYQARMLIHPAFHDDYSAAVLTEEQTEQFLALSDDLPGLLERLDARKHVRDKENNLTEVLSEYFLKSYLSSML